MKKLFVTLLLLFPLVAFGQLTTPQGGTGTTSPSGILFGDATLHLKTLKVGSGLLLSGGTLSSTAAGGTVTEIDTLWPIIGGPITTTGTLSLQLATSTLTATGPLIGSFTQIGSGGSLGIQASSPTQNGYLSLGDYQLLHTASTTYTTPLVYTLATNAVTCTNASNGITGCMTANDWALLHAATTTFSSPLVYTLSTNAVTCPTCQISAFTPEFIVTLLNSFSTTTLATTTSIWTKGIFIASSTVTASQFPYASTTAITSTNASTSNLMVSLSEGIGTSSPANLFSINQIATFAVSTSTIYTSLNIASTTNNACLAFNGLCSTPRWLAPYHGGFDVAATSQDATGGNSATNLNRFWYSEFETDVPIVVDRLCYQVGSTAVGNAMLAIYGPVVTEESIVSAPFVASTTATAQGSTSQPQCIAPGAGTVNLGVGRYYIGVVFDNASSTFERESNAITIALGTSGFFQVSLAQLPFTTATTTGTQTGTNIPAFKIRTVKPN